MSRSPLDSTPSFRNGTRLPDELSSRHAAKGDFVLKEARQNNLSDIGLREDGLIPLAVELLSLDRTGP
jgi:hypothetical protein